MDAEGVAPRPIDTMMGPHHLNEVFFTDVEVGPEAVLGQVDCGWDVISAVLSFERVGMPRYARIERILSALAPLLDERPDEPALPLEHARALVGCRVARLLSYRAVAFHEAGEVPLVEPAVARVCATLLEQEAAELALRIAGPDALAHDAAAPLAGEIQEFWRYARAATISSGTVEIQRLLAARGLIKGLA
jgi:alkylation response protein AidB-like acyl-CoA dehydrogenase